VLIGKDHDTRIDLNPSPKLRLLSYTGLINRARAELEWLRRVTRAPSSLGAVTSLGIEL
jgi:hypothetical protein